MKTLLAFILLCGVMAAQTVYYNHPKGMAVGPFYKGQKATVAKLTLPAGTYHAFFKSQFEPTPDGCCVDGFVNCSMQASGIPNVTSPYTVDAQSIVIRTNYLGTAGNMVMEAAFQTNGGQVSVTCTGLDSRVQSAFISLSATKIGTLVRQ